MDGYINGDKQLDRWIDADRMEGGAEGLAILMSAPGIGMYRKAGRLYTFLRLAYNKILLDEGCVLTYHNITG